MQYHNFLVFFIARFNSACIPFLFLCGSFLTSTSGWGQEDLPMYDELNVEFTVPELGTLEIPVAIKGQEAYLPVKELFDMLQVKSEVSGETISGFIIHPDSTYRISFQANRIQFAQQEFELPDAHFIESPAGFYLRADYFGRIFGLHTDFSFRSLSVALETEKELPVIKNRRLEKMRENLNEVKGVVHPDTIVPRSYPFFKPGMLDWGVVATQQTEVQDDNRLTLGLGTLLFGGEANFLLNYSTRVPFQSRNQFYQWRLINNDSRFFKQLTVGRIQTRATSSLFAPVSGLQVSNSPLQSRRSYGTYNLSDYTEPHWTVELYVNNVLVNYTQADASGFYTFDVPLMYGNTNVNLRFYGPYGEERVETRLINIPYNFVPKNELEYTLSAGLVENEHGSRFSRFDMNYGLSNSVTLGGGAEYFSEVRGNQIMPFVNSSIRLASNLLFTGEYMYGVKGDALLSYRSPSNLQVDLNYVKYHEDQTAINYNYLEERKISLSTPIRSRNFSLFSRFSFNQIIMPTTKFMTAQLLLSGAVMGISTNLTTYGIYNDHNDHPTIYSALSQSYRLPYNFLFSPRVQYDFTNTTFNNFVLELERPVFHQGYLNVAYEKNFLRNAHIFELGLRYSFGFAQTALNSRIGNRNTSFVESARGSLLFDDNTGVILTSSRSSITRAALTIIPFLDLDRDGKKGPMEPGVPGMELRNRSGRVSYNKDRTILRITELQPYTDILLEIDPVSLDNIAWKISNPKIAVHTVPNHFHEIHVPVEVLGEAGGMVYFKDEGVLRGQGRIIVKILDETGKPAAELLSEGDGYFSYLGLAPGNYTALIDQEQLKNLGYRSSPETIEFEIEVSEFGDIMDTLEFILEPDTPSTLEPDVVQKSPMKESEEAQVPAPREEKVLIDLGERGYYAFSDTDENIKIIQQLLKELGYKAGKIDGIYGEKTLRAVRSFQRESQIRLDGIFGPETLGALMERIDK